MSVIIIRWLIFIGHLICDCKGGDPVFILQKRKIGLREADSSAQSHTAPKWQRRDSKSGHSDSRVYVL